jgi:hypothetical protein
MIYLEIPHEYRISALIVDHRKQIADNIDSEAIYPFNLQMGYFTQQNGWDYINNMHINAIRAP